MEEIFSFPILLCSIFDIRYPVCRKEYHTKFKTLIVEFSRKYSCGEKEGIYELIEESRDRSVIAK